VLGLYGTIAPLSKLTCSHIKGQVSHKIVTDARSLLCNMTHRYAGFGNRTNCVVAPLELMLEMAMGPV
jgi:hypothetical protein